MTPPFETPAASIVPGARPTMIVSEGMLMFFERERVRALVERLAESFPGGEMLFDAIGGLMVRAPWLHDTLPRTGVRFRWGLAGTAELGTWSDRIEVVAVRSMLDEAPDRWRWMRWLRHVPSMRRQFTVAHLRFRVAGR
jgi:O-methyltransferase involved in polyketide biosynthesis